MSADPNDRTATLQPRVAAERPTQGSVAGDHALAAPVDAGTGPEPEAELPVDAPDRYEQICEHARGGLGRIVRAVDRRLGRTVAVKELLRRDDWHEARFVREALSTARLEHPGIVPVHEAGRWPNGDPYYVMKLVEGRTLKELMAGHTSWRERGELLPHIIAIADAVGYAHSEGVIHRDVKPSNVIGGSFGETIVVDWGLARDIKRDIAEPLPELLAEGSGISTISGKVVGTPAYLAPELARGELVDARADVYAIGAVLYELMAGKAPHADETPKAMLDRVIAGPPAPIDSVVATAPPELADIIGKAMARLPEERDANATLLAEDLRAFLTGKLVSAHAYTPWQLVRKKLAQHRGVVAVALASAVALGAVGVESFRTVVAERDIARGGRAGRRTVRVPARRLGVRRGVHARRKAGRRRGARRQRAQLRPVEWRDEDPRQDAVGSRGDRGRARWSGGRRRRRDGRGDRVSAARRRREEADRARQDGDRARVRSERRAPDRRARWPRRATRSRRQPHPDRSGVGAPRRDRTARQHAACGARRTEPGRGRQRRSGSRDRADRSPDHVAVT